MFASIFGVIQLILRLFGAWDQFLSWSDAQRRAEDEIKRQARDKAVDKAGKDESDDDIFKDETGVVDNLP